MEINQYPLESLTFQDNDFYDIDFWTGSGYQTKKILGSTIKAGILAAVENIYNADGTLTGNRSINLDNKVLSFESANAGEFNSLITDSTTSTSTFNQSIAQIYLAIVDILTAGKNVAFDINTTNTQLVLSDGAGNSSSLQISGVGSALNFTDGITNYRVEANENGVLINTSYTLPATDGTAGQVMTTNGTGVVSWQDPTAPTIVDSAKREVVEFINKTGAPILEGTIVYLKTSSSSGTHPEVELADASTEATSSKTIGAIYETTANNAIGLIVTSGEVDNLNTSMYSIGDRLWLSTTAGQVTTTPPSAPDHLVFIGIVTRSQNGNGRILYSIQNGYELNELHDVSVPLPNNGDVLTFNSVSGLWEASSLGLNFFNETQNTTAPNATVPVNSLTANGISTNIDVAIRPKGTGALLAAIPDSTFVGGNKRGQHAVDLQMSRSSQVMVASGNFSAILGGSNNTVIGANSAAAGSGNSANGSLSFAIGHNNSSTNNNSYSFGNENLSNGVNSYSIGRFNNASGSSAVAIGGSVGTYNTASSTRSVAIGESNTASFTNAFAIGYFNNSSALNSFAIGSNNNASGNYSFALGVNADTQGSYGKMSFANGRFGVNGDAQNSKIILRCATSGATSAIMSSDPSVGPSITNQIILPSQGAFRFKGSIVVKRQGSVDCAAWEIDGLIVRSGNEATTTLVVGNVNVISNIPSYNAPTLTANTALGGLRITANGSGVPLLPLRWVATIETTEVSGF